jgi:hypothetical protein
MKTFEELRIYLQDREVIKRYLRGDPTLDIIWDCGVTKATIYNILRRAGVTPNRHRRKR